MAALRCFGLANSWTDSCNDATRTSLLMTIRAEFRKEHGFIDLIVPRRDLRNEIARIIDYCGK